MILVCKELFEIFTNWKELYELNQGDSNKLPKIKREFIHKILNFLKTLSEKNIHVIPNDKKNNFIFIGPRPKL